jgi:hypothetical protein
MTVSIISNYYHYNNDMGLINFIKKILNKSKDITNIQENPKNNENDQIYSENETKLEIHSIWDFLEFNDNTQAAHISNVIRFDEWVSMDEIRRRIWELFQIEYKNERSLYPYLKTMVDLGLIETSNIGGKRKWRKRELLLKITKKKKNSEDSENNEEIMISATN